MNAIVQSEQHAIAAKTPAIPAGPLANAIAAMQAGMTVEQMQGLMNIQKEWEANEARKSYVADMALFKLNPPEIFKTKLVSFSGTEYMHATLGDVTRAVLEALARHGFSHNWETKQKDGMIDVTCKITHRMGHSESTNMIATPDTSGKKNAIQAVASSITYMQRYTLLAACGLATMDMQDDDGQGSGAPVEYDAAKTLATWLQRADQAVSMESLQKTRGMAGEEFRAGNDVQSWNAFKAHYANLKAKFEGAAS